MATIIAFNPNRAVDLNSFAVPGALATFYDSGTTSERTVYSDPECTLPHPSPLPADGAGVFPPVYDTGDGDVRVEVTTPDGVMLAGYPMDPARIISTDSVGASGIAFEPTEEIPVTNVQAAIETVQANMIEPLADFGLGVTGNATLLSNLDAVGTASGAYRYDGTTAGTFPSGVTASNGGLVRIWRATDSVALMILTPEGSTRQHIRNLSGTSWSAWGYVMASTDTATDAVWAAGTSTAPAVPTPKAIRAATGALGVGQTWQNVTSSRNHGTVYTNSTGRPIMVAIAGDAQSVPANLQVSPNGTSWVSVGRFGEAGQLETSVSTIVPAGWRYRVNGDVAFNFWSELR